jgi:hypothetical protein
MGTLSTLFPYRLALHVARVAFVASFRRMASCLLDLRYLRVRF